MSYYYHGTVGEIILDKKTKESERLEISNFFRNLKPLTKAQKKFLFTPIKNYLFYNAKTRIATCTCCKADNIDVKKIKLRHKQKIKCPQCNKDVTVRAFGYGHNFIDMYSVNIPVVMNDDIIVLRIFNITVDYKTDYKSPYVSVSEIIRDCFTNDENKSFEYYKNGYEGWHKNKNCNLSHVLPYEECFVYDSLNNITKVGKYKYLLDIIKFYLENKCNNSPYKLYQLLSLDKSILDMYEKLYKIGFYNVLSDLMNIYAYIQLGQCKNKNLFQFLNINKDDYRKMLKIGNPTMKELEIARIKKSFNVNEEKALIIKDLFNSRKYILRRYERLSKYSIVKLKKYLDTQKDNKINVSYYIDYLEMCKYLKYDLRNTFVAFPKNLIQAHDEVVERYNHQKDIDTGRVIDDDRVQKELSSRELYLKFVDEYKNKYSFKYNGIVSIIPETTDDIVKEGQNLHHCVGTYTQRVANGEIIILFVRRENDPEHSYYTMEIRDGEVKQLRGYRNCDLMEDVKEFKEQFEKEILKIGNEKKKCGD